MTYSKYPLEGVHATYSLDANGVVQGLRAPNTQDSNGADVPGPLIPLGNALPFLAIDGSAGAPSYSFASSASSGWYNAGSGVPALSVSGVRVLSASGSGLFIDGGSGVTIRDFLGGVNTATLIAAAAQTLAQRNGVNAQTFWLYNTYTDALNYERLSLEWAGNVATITAENAGTGTLRTLKIGTASTNVLGFMGAVGQAQKTGFGVPTGPGVIANFPGATATLAQCSQAIAQIITDLKALGFYGA